MNYYMVEDMTEDWNCTILVKANNNKEVLNKAWILGKHIYVDEEIEVVNYDL